MSPLLLAYAPVIAAVGEAAVSADPGLLERFARPQWAFALLAFPVAIAAYAWGARARAKIRATLATHAVFDRLLASVDRRARSARAIAMCGAVLGLSVALLRPQHGGSARILPTRGLDIVLAVDYSKSMLVQDVYPSRSERLEAELAHFLDDARRRGDRVGLVVFAGSARGLPVTSDTRLLEMYLERADPLHEYPGGTALGPAMRLGLDFLIEARRGAVSGSADTGGDSSAGDAAGGEDTPLAPDEADQVLILLTDGEDHQSRPLEMAQEAARLGVRVYTVGIGSSSGQPVMQYDERGEAAGWVRDEQGEVVMTRLDEETLRAIAERTRGAYIKVESERFGLDEVREQIAGLAAAQREDTVQIDREESYPFVLWPALGLVCVALGLGDRKRRPRADEGSQR